MSVHSLLLAIKSVGLCTPSYLRERYRVLINYCVFPYNFVIFLNSASFAAALVFYLPGVCTHTDTEGKQSTEYFKKFGKNTIFNEHPVYFYDLGMT